MYILKDYPLKEFNTFKINVSAKNYVEICNLEDLYSLKPILMKEKYIVLGGGSNILFTSDYPGYVLKNNLLGSEKLSETDDEVEIQISSGENWHEFVMYCANNNYYGVENLALIPGTIGASVIQNINAYGAEVSSVVKSVTYLDLHDFKLVNLSNTECLFNYRSSIFKTHLAKNAFVVNVTFRLKKKSNFNLKFLNSYGGILQELEDITKGKEPTIIDVTNAVIRLRTKKLPDIEKFPNSGSFFIHPIVSREKYLELAKTNSTNPDFTHFETPDGNIKLSAGWAIEYAGLKGYRYKTVGVYEKHALVLVNYDTSSRESGRYMKELVDIITNKVQEKWGILLKSEVVIV